MERLPYLITFGTYGSWLHGDERGSWEPRRDRPNDGYVWRDDFRRGFEQREMTQPEFTIEPSMGPVIERAILEVCRKREWAMLGMNVRMQHVHVVVATEGKPEAAMQAFKAYSTRRLRESEVVDPERCIWARHGSTRHLRKEASVESAVEYVLHRQGATLPGSIFWKVDRAFQE